MMIDKGFFVENYVGSYEMQVNSELDATMIVSKEVNFAEDEESSLRKKRIFEFDRRDDDYIFLQLANVDISCDDSILDYCNRYGLPYSSQICYDQESGIDEDVNLDTAKRLSERVSTVYSRNDTMDRLEFCRLAVQVRKLMELKEILDTPAMDAPVCAKLIPLLTYLIFYSREFIYDYGETDPLPHTRIMNLQYFFHYVCRHDKEILQRLSPADRIATFLQRYEHLTEDQALVQDPMLLSHLMSEENQRVLSVFKQIFLQDQYFGPLIFSFPDATEQMVTLEDHTVLVEVVRVAAHTKTQFSVDEYGQVTFNDEVEYTGSKDVLRELAFDVLRDAINEGLTQVTPQLIFEEGILRGEWQLRFQMEGIYMELFTELASSSLYRLCANPTCGKFFSASRNRSNKIYCCHECAALQAKRNQRARRKSTRVREK